MILACCVVEKMKRPAHNFLSKLAPFHYVFWWGDNQILLHIETHLF